jgi:putative sigma-54 modulation protein
LTAGRQAPASIRNQRERLMNLHLTGHHVEITPAIRTYVTSKLDRINRHFDHVIDVDIVMTVEKLDQKVEVNVHLSGKDIHIEANDSDMYAAIDRLTDKLDRQILKHKERFMPRHAPGIKRIEQA